MHFFTRPFTKDLLWSIVFIACLYGIIHNPYTRPIPQALPGNWSIQMMQNPLVFGVAGHNYLALKDTDGLIVTELHGLATDMNRRMWKHIGTNSNDRLQVWKFDGTIYDQYDTSHPGVILFEGNEVETRKIWSLGEACIESINAKNIGYPPYGISLQKETENSNSVAKTLAYCMGFDTQHIGLITPGSGVNLLLK